MLMQNNGPLQRRVVAACLLTIVYSAGIGVIRFVGSEGEPGSLRISVSLVAPFVVAALVALLAQDMFLAGTIIMLIGVMTVVGTLISDLLLAWIDPRIRLEVT